MKNFMSFKDYVLTKESSAATRLRSDAALGLKPPIPDAMLHSRSTASPFEVEQIQKKNKKKKKKKGNMHCSESRTSRGMAPQKPESVEDGQCPDCGSPATLYNYGIDAGGNEDHRTDCSNPKCANYGLTKKSTHPAAPRGNMSRGYM